VNPHDIQAALKKAGSSQQQVADELDPPATRGSVNLVIHGKRRSARVAKHIAAKLGVTLETLWPGRYGHDKSTTKPAPDRRNGGDRRGGGHGQPMAA
jgi:lambda repressor-like predicted transcriptional regulator